MGGDARNRIHSRVSGLGAVVHETASFVVSGANEQRSVALRVLSPVGEWIPVGNCTVPENHAVPEPGTVVEVRYLYAYPGGDLAQPSYLGPRSDIAPEECVAGQLKFKSEERRAARGEELATG